MLGLSLEVSVSQAEVRHYFGSSLTRYCRSTVRMAQAIGLNIDPMLHDPHMSLKEADIRRRAWWTIAGLDFLLCHSLGRPHAITYWSTQLPQDRPDDTLIDAQGKPGFRYILILQRLDKRVHQLQLTHGLFRFDDSIH